MAAKAGHRRAELDQAEAELRSGAVESAARLFAKHEADDPSGRAHFGLAQCANARGEHHRALAHLQSVEELAPDLPGLAGAMGAALLGIGLVEQAHAQLAQAVQADSANAEAWFSLARACQMRGDQQACLEACREALRANPAHPQAPGLGRAACLTLGLDPAEFGLPAGRKPAAGSARPEPSRKRDAASPKAEAQDLPGRGRGKLRPSAAPSAFEPAAARKSKRPSTPVVRCTAAEVARDLALGDAALARAELEEAAALYQRHLDSSEAAHARIGLARCASARGDHHQALGWLQQVEKSEPEQPLLPAAMAVVLYRLGCYAEARGSFERALELDPEDALLWNEYIAFLRSTGDFRGAVDACRRILRRSVAEKRESTSARPSARAGVGAQPSKPPARVELPAPSWKPSARAAPPAPSSKPPARAAHPAPSSKPPARGRGEGKRAPSRPPELGRWRGASDAEQPAPAEPTTPPPAAAFEPRSDHYDLAIPGAAGALAGGVAHYMNSVLATIMGRASVLEVEIGGDDQKQQDVHEILDACRRGRAMTAELLRFVRAGSSADEIVSLNQVVRNVAALLAASVPPIIAVKTELDPALWHTRADASQLTHALHNLCRNAIEAMAKGGTLTITTNNEPGARPDGASKIRARKRLVRLRVIDTGRGMDAATVERCLEPFFTTKPKAQGKGLGLAVAHGTVVNRGGSLTIDSRPGAGTTVVIRLPAAEQTAGEAERVAARGDARRLVLLADDDRGVRRTAKRLLESLGYRVLLAAGGVEALELYRANEHEIAVVVLDRIMPDMDGLETCRRILDLRRDACVLLVSGHGPGSNIDQLLAAGGGFRGFLQKPFLREELGRAVAEALEKS